jgi:hypothetical protein
MTVSTISRSMYINKYTSISTLKKNVPEADVFRAFQG